MCTRLSFFYWHDIRKFEDLLELNCRGDKSISYAFHDGVHADYLYLEILYREDRFVTEQFVKVSNYDCIQLGVCSSRWIIM